MLAVEYIVLLLCMLSYSWEFVLCLIGKTAAEFQVTDEFIAQLPKQLIIPNSHLQIFKSIGQGNLQTNKACTVSWCQSFFYRPCSLIPSPPPSFLPLHMLSMESWAGPDNVATVTWWFCIVYTLYRRVWSCLQSKAVEKTGKMWSRICCSEDNARYVTAWQQPMVYYS